MSGIVGFQDSLETRIASVHQSMAARQKLQPAGFTPRDQSDLDHWSSDTRRVVICTSEMGPFAMLYEEGRPWASWGVERQGRSVLLWNCVTLADIGRFASMIDALAAVPIGGFVAPVTNVIQFIAARPAAALGEPL